MYDPGDRVRVKATGEVLTIQSDGSPTFYPPIACKESDRLFAADELEPIHGVQGGRAPKEVDMPKRRKKRTFLVRTNCEYSTVMEAKDGDDAMEKAQKIDVAEWDSKAWSPIEYEEIEEVK